ncbi:choice-of-anchor O protein [Marinobacter sp.]|uniref:choice-of-anchor O protein n=1 Tax=Marinobacter sp. TaxID=50741 RepID=UPI003569AC28
MKQKLLVSAIVAAIACPGAALAATGLSFGESVELSANGGANKSKISRLGNGRLLAVFGDYVDPNGYTIYDVKAQAERPARDLFVRTCEAGLDCAVESNWSELKNISNTASQSSIATDWDGFSVVDETDPRNPQPFYGDSEKPNLFAAGSRIVITWVDKYCPSLVEGEPSKQRSVSYLTLGNREVPFACTYAVTSSDAGATWSNPVQLSSGIRDAKQDVNRGLSTGEWAITWQEDPRGLQLGEADGPGDGASGANVSSGTDIWYSRADSFGPDGAVWSDPVRITDNFNGQTASGNFNTIFSGTGPVADEAIESGIAGASRANLAVQPGYLEGEVAQAIVAYEETKGSGGLDEGKFVRYHTFDWNNPVAWTDQADPSTAPAETAGCIISDPTLNARRVRFVVQGAPGTETNMRMGIFWKEGEFTQGGPSDIMLRKGIVNGGNGFSPGEMVPAVDANCFESDFLTAIGLDNAPALNMSSRTEEAEATTDADIPTSTLSDDTYQKVEENAIAHRGLLRGDDLYVGYTYTPVLAELLYTNTKNYNFYIRHYDGVAGTWSAPRNLSNITDTTINVREPRLVGTPGSTAGCPANPEECRDVTRYYVAWGTQTNVSEWSLEEPSELDLYAALAEDKGATYTDVVRFAGEADDVEDFESQIQMTPAGNNLYVVWNENRDGGTHAMFRQSTTVEVADDGTDGGTDDGDSTASSSSSDGTLFGCSYKPGAPFDPTLFLLTALAIGGLTVRKIKARA